MCGKVERERPVVPYTLITIGDPLFNEALEMRQRGWQVIPARYRDKLPMIKWKPYQAELADEGQVQEWFGGEDRNLFIVTGSVSRLAVLDCDDDVAVKWWFKKLGAAMRETARVNTGKGHHFYFQLAEGESHRGRSSSGGESGAWDLRCDGGGVVAPPSVHPDGRVYQWADGKGPDAIQMAPAGLWVSEPTEGDGEAEVAPRSMLAHLLAHPAAEGERNNWLTKVAGHYAKTFKYEDAYLESCRLAGEMVGLGEAEWQKTANSIWETEHAKPAVALRAKYGEPLESNGYMISGETCILTQVKLRDDEDGHFELGLAQILSGDLRVKARILDEEDELVAYEVEIVTKDSTRLVELPAAKLTDTRSRDALFVKFGLITTTPDGVHPRVMREGQRFAAYLESQDAPTQKYVPALGWLDDANGYLTPDAIVTADGPQPLGGYRPHPSLKTKIPYRYGFESVDDTRAILREVMTFHFPQVTAVFGAWWAAVFIKSQLQRRFAQFPVMAMEAPSESGKSTGFFPMMLKLSGSEQGEGVFTKAALRDYLAAHRNAVVWMDDLDDLSSYEELIRGVTVGASLAKKGMDHTSQVSIKLEGALSLSGESLGLRDQKALADRTLHLEVPSPVDRMSERDGADHSQWLDVKDIDANHDLNNYAGTILQQVAQQITSGNWLEEAMTRAKEESGKGRFADKMAVVRVGARMLRMLLDDDEWGESTEWVHNEVEQWIADQTSEYDSDENALTLRILPAALRAWGLPRKPMAPDVDRRRAATPVFVGGKAGDNPKAYGAVWFSPGALAEWWRDFNRGSISERTASERALVEQGHRLGAGKKNKRWFTYVDGDGKAGSNYWRLPEEWSMKVINRAIDNKENDDHSDC